MKKNIVEILYILGDYKKKLPFMLFLFVVLSVLDIVGLSLVVPYLSLLSGSNAIESDIFMTFIDFLSLGYDRESQLIIFGCLLIAVFSIKTYLIYSINNRVLTFGNDNMISTRSKLMLNYQSMSYSRFINKNSSDYINVIQNLTSSLSIVLANLLKLLSDILIGSGILILLMVVDIVMLIELIAILFSMVWIYDSFFRKNLYIYGKITNEAGETVLRRLKEAFEGFKEIRVLGNEKYFHDAVQYNTRVASELGVKSSLIAIMPRYIIELLMLVFIVSLVFISIFFSDDGIDSLTNSIMLFGVASIRLIPVFSGISSEISALRHHRHSISILHQDLAKIKHTKLDADKLCKVDNEPFYKLTLKDVSFKYQKTNNPSISNISIELKSNEAVGIIGESGSGKTTLVNIMLGLLEYENGDIYYNKIPFKECIGNWQSQIAYLPQQVFLIDGTLSENIALGESNIDNERVISSLRKSRLLDWVRELPDGVDTIVGESGIRLSGGQRQRVALARAFYFDRRILVMDEATSALDNKTEKEVVDEIHNLKGEMTIIVIAHRLSTVKYCDRIYRLERGSIIQEGSYDEVIKKEEI